MAKPPFVIVNPVAANQRVGRDWPKIKDKLEAIIGPFEFAHTQSTTDAADIARKALRDGFTDIASLGGDGTHSLVVNGFFEDGKPITKDAVLNLLPVGTGGDYRKAVDLNNKDLEHFARLMVEADANPVDVGQIEYVNHEGRNEQRIFINVASFGIGGLVDRIVNTTTKVLGGKMSFLFASIRGMIQYKPSRVTVHVDGKVVFSEKALLVAACNGQYFGGGMHIGPEAELADGLFDFVILPWRSRVQHLIKTSKIYSGRHVDEPGVVTLRGREMKAESDGECLLDIDGEAPGGLPVTIRVLPRTLRLRGWTPKSAV